VCGLDSSGSHFVPVVSHSECYTECSREFPILLNEHPDGYLSLTLSKKNVLVFIVRFESGLAVLLLHF
jgi:hypothetical protein